MFPLIGAVIVFILLWWAISLITFPATFPSFAKTVLYVLLIVVAVVWIGHFFHLF